MQPPTLSASAIKAWEECPAMFKAGYVDRVRVQGVSGGAGDQGSMLHEVLEWWVKEGAEEDPKLLTDKIKELGPKYGLDQLQIKQCKAMLSAWYERWLTDPPYEVISTEIKSSFTVKVKYNGDTYEQPVTYIWDRCDRREDKAINVVDYKSWVTALTADDIFNLVQTRIYALAAAIQFKDEKPPYIWVEFDQLRYGRLAVRFNRDEIKVIYDGLKQTIIDILDDDGHEERVGNACRWCVRAASCKSLERAVEAGSVLSYSTPQEAAVRVAEINAALGAMTEVKAQLVQFLEDYLRDKNWMSESFEGGVTVKITPKSKRELDQEAANRALGPELAGKYGKLLLGTVDDLLAGDDLTPEQKEALERAINQGATTSTNAYYPKK